MAVNLSPVGGVAAQFFDNSGNVLTGGKLLTYLAGTTTPAVTYTTSGGNIPQPNPIILNASGRVPGSGEIWLTDGILYKFVLTDSNDVLIATYDNINGINSNFVAFTNQQEIQTATAGQTVFNLTTAQYQPGTNSLSVFVDGVNQYGPGAQYAYLETDSDTVTFINGLHVGALVKFTTSQLNSGAGQNAAQTSFTGFKGQVGNVQNLADDDGSDWIGFQQAGTSAVARSAQDKMRDILSVKDFGAVGDGVTDDTGAIQSAINYVESVSILSAEGKTLFFPAGLYQISSPLQISDQMVIEGDGAESTKIRTTTGNIFNVTSAGVEFRDLFFLGPTGVSSNGISFTNGNSCIVSRCVFQNQTTGIQLTTSYAVEIIGCIFDVCYLYGVYSGTSCHNLIIDTTGFFTCGVLNTGQAVRIDAASDNLNFTNNDFEYCYVNIQMQDCNSVQITGNYMEYHDAECFNFVGVNTGVVIESNWIALGQVPNGGATLTLSNITGGRFIHNTIFNQSVNFNSATLNAFTVGVNKKSGTGLYEPSVWIAPTLQNSWAQQVNYTQIGYFKDENGWVHLRGGCVGGAVPNAIFTLPAGYRPTAIGVFGTASANGTCIITVNTNGTVVPSTAPSNNPNLDNISFWVGD